MNKIDVYMLEWPINDKFQQKLVDQVNAEPVNFFIGPAIVGDHTKALLDLIYSKGTSEYFTIVENDDEIIPGIFQILMDTIEQFPNLDLYCTQEKVIDDNNKILREEKGNIPHHLAVYKRSLLDKMRPVIEKYKFGASMIVGMAALERKSFKMIDDFGYLWRIHNNNSHSNIPGGLSLDINEIRKVALE